MVPLVVVVFFIFRPIEPQPYPVVYVVANPVRGLLDRKRSEVHLQSSNESIKTQQNKNKTKNDKNKGRITQSTCQKNIGEEQSIERVRIVPAPSHPITSPDRNHTTPKRIASTTVPYSQGFRFLYRHSRRRLGSTWVGPINATLKRLKLATVTPGTTSTLSASSASVFLCRCWDALSSSFTHAAINLQPPSLTVLHQAPGSSAAVFQSLVMPNSRRFSATQSVHYFSFPPGLRFPAFSNSPDMTLLGNLRSLIMQRSGPDHNNLLVRRFVSMLSHSVCWRASL